MRLVPGCLQSCCCVLSSLRRAVAQGPTCSLSLLQSTTTWCPHRPWGHSTWGTSIHTMTFPWVTFCTAHSLGSGQQAPELGCLEAFWRLGRTSAALLQMHPSHRTSALFSPLPPLLWMLFLWRKSLPVRQKKPSHSQGTFWFAIKTLSKHVGYFFPFYNRKKEVWFLGFFLFGLGFFYYLLVGIFFACHGSFSPFAFFFFIIIYYLAKFSQTCYALLPPANSS